MIAWSVELSEFMIKYAPRGLMKVQCLVDFFAKLTTAIEMAATMLLRVVETYTREASRLLY